jgi:hypothetical protein
MILSAILCLASSPLRLDSEWTAPTQLPFERVHAITRMYPETYIGGLRGLYQGREGHWTKIDERPVKQMAVLQKSVWVLFGDGSVDKLDPAQNRLLYDILGGSAKRPWTSTIYSDPKGVVLGGLGGWVERGDNMSEIYRKELDGDVVTSVARTEGDLWIGTQKKGLFAYNGGQLRRFGFAAGLPDSWVTAMAYFDKQLYVGMADGGVVRKVGDKFILFDSPCRKVRFLAAFDGSLAVGGMEGCWIHDRSGWQQLSSEETTCLTVVDGKLVVGSPRGIRWWTNA